MQRDSQFTKLNSNAFVCLSSFKPLYSSPLPLFQFWWNTLLSFYFHIRPRHLRGMSSTASGGWRACLHHLKLFSDFVNLDDALGRGGGGFWNDRLRLYLVLVLLLNSILRFWPNPEGAFSCTKWCEGVLIIVLGRAQSNPNFSFIPTAQLKL